MSNYGIFVYTTHKNFSRCQKILETWGSDIKNLFFYTDRHADPSTTQGTFIKATDDDTYASNVVKNLYAIVDAYERRYDWSFFIGDDNYLFKQNFELYINSQNKEENSIFGAELSGTWPPDRSLSYLDGAAGILFNKGSLRNFVKLLDKNLEDYKHDSEFADVVIEFIRQKGNIPMNTTNNDERLGGLYFGGLAPWDYNNREMLRRAITLHYIEEHLVNGWNFDRLWEFEKSMANESARS